MATMDSNNFMRTMKGYIHLCGVKDKKIKSLITTLEGVTSEKNTLEQRLKHLVMLGVRNIGGGLAELAPNQLDEDDVHRSDDEDTSSVEFDEHCNVISPRIIQQTTIEDTNEMFRQMRLRERIPSDSESQAPSIDVPQVSQTIFMKVVDENVKLKQRLKHERKAWINDNAVGRDSIEHLRNDVGKLKWEKQKMAEEIKSLSEDQPLVKKDEEKDVSNAEIEMLKSENTIVKQQMITFQEDFESERRDRETTVKKLKQLMQQYENTKMQIKALMEENNRLKSQPRLLQQHPRVPQQYVQPIQQYVQPAQLSAFPMRAGLGGEQVWPQQYPYMQHLPPVVTVDSEVTSTDKHNRTSPPSVKRSPSQMSDLLIDSDKPQRPDPTGSEALPKSQELFVCKRCEKEFTTKDDHCAHEEKCFS